MSGAACPSLGRCAAPGSRFRYSRHSGSPTQHILAANRCILFSISRLKRNPSKQRRTAHGCPLPDASIRVNARKLELCFRPLFSRLGTRSHRFDTLYADHRNRFRRRSRHIPHGPQRSPRSESFRKIDATVERASHSSPGDATNPDRRSGPESPANCGVRPPGNMTRFRESPVPDAPKT